MSAWIRQYLNPVMPMLGLVLVEHCYIEEAVAAAAAGVGRHQ